MPRDDQPASAGPKITVQLKRSHWVGEVRHDAPELLELDLDTALRLIEDGIAGRVDPLTAGVADSA